METTDGRESRKKKETLFQSSAKGRVEGRKVQNNGAQVGVRDC